MTDLKQFLHNTPIAYLDDIEETMQYRLQIHVYAYVWHRVKHFKVGPITISMMMTHQ